jgi:hypothetical protein
MDAPRKKIGEAVTDIAFAFGFASRLALEHDVSLDNLTSLLRESYEQVKVAQVRANRARDAQLSDALSTMKEPEFRVRQRTAETKKGRK